MIYDLRFTICDFTGAVVWQRLLLPLLGERVGVRAVVNSFENGAE